MIIIDEHAFYTCAQLGIISYLFLTTNNLSVNGTASTRGLESLKLSWVEDSAFNTDRENWEGNFLLAGWSQWSRDW